MGIWTDGWEDEQIDGWTDRSVERRLNEQKN